MNTICRAGVLARSISVTPPRSQWRVKETMSEYIKLRLNSLSNYLGSLQLTDEEEALRAKILAEFRKGKAERRIFASNLNPCNLERDSKFYAENGVTGPFSTKTISQKTLDSLFSKYTGIPKTLTPQEYRNARVRQEWQNGDVLKLACNSEIVSRVSSILGRNIKVRFTGIHEIPPNAGSFSSITDGKIAALCAHSDTNLAARLSKRGLYGPIVDLDSINVWVSVTGTNESNGPLYVFPKTHQWSVLTPSGYLSRVESNSSAFERNLALVSLTGFVREMIANHTLCYEQLQKEMSRVLSEIRKIEIYTNPGDAILFSSHLMHGSDTNFTDKPRLAISIRYSSALNLEGPDNLNAVRTLFSPDERRLLGWPDGDLRAPIIQVSGTDCHEGSKPIDLNQLHNILQAKQK